MGRTKWVGNACCIPGCHIRGNSSKIQFYRFPARNHDHEKKKQSAAIKVEVSSRLFDSSVKPGKTYM